jgi:sugar O-acyltransferase (sialic acid O-acetyltransferase NeuD family)
MSSCYIFGAGGHGKVVLDAMRKAGIACAGFVDDRGISTWGSLPVIRLVEMDVAEKPKFHIAVGSNSLRSAILQRLKDFDFFNVIHPAAVVSDSALIGVGTLITANAVIGPDARLGNHCIINHAAVVDHDCVVGDFTHIAPGVCLGGGVKVGAGCLVGAGAVILPGVSISDNVIVGAGAVVTKNVLAGTVVGIPAKTIR